MTALVSLPPSTSPPNKFGGDPVAFDVAMQNHLQWQTDVVPQQNAQNAENNLLNANIVSQLNNAAALAATAAHAATAASAVTNYRGAWVGLSGALNTPASVLHLGRLWLLTASTANVVADVPGTSNKWAALDVVDVAQRVGCQPTLDADFATERYRVYTPGQGLADIAFGDLFSYSGAGRNVTGPLGTVQLQAANVPRIDYDPISRQGLGLSTWDAQYNLFKHSDDLSQASVWGVSNLSVTAGAATRPSGQVFAKLVEDGASTDHYVYQGVADFSAGGAVYTLSVDVLPAERSCVELWVPASLFGDGSVRRAVFDCAQGVVLYSDTDTVPGIKNMGDGVWRCALTFAPTVATSTSLLIRLHTGVGGSSFYQGVSGRGLYATAAMLSPGFYSAPHIPSTTAQVVTPVDVLYLAGTNFSRWYNKSEGTLLRVLRPDYAALISTPVAVNGLQLTSAGSHMVSLRCVADPSSPTADMYALSGQPVDVPNAALGAAPVVAQAFAYSRTGYAYTSSVHGSVVTGLWGSPGCMEAMQSLSLEAARSGNQVRWVYWPKDLSAHLSALVAV